MNALYCYLLAIGIAKQKIDDDTSCIECYCTSEAMLHLVLGLNFHGEGFTYHAELIASCTWLLTRD